MPTLTGNQRMGLVALVVFALDQASKLAMLQWLDYGQTYDVIPGFFKFVLWGNTGAAWSIFHDNNALLGIISLAAMAMLFVFRHHFEAHRVMGQWALGLLFGGIAGNVLDRLHPGREHVIDFLYFHVLKRDGQIAGFPAFNIADTAICIGVGLIFLLSWSPDAQSVEAPANESTAEPS